MFTFLLWNSIWSPLIFYQPDEPARPLDTETVSVYILWPNLTLFYDRLIQRLGYSHSLNYELQLPKYDHYYQPIDLCLQLPLSIAHTAFLLSISLSHQYKIRSFQLLWSEYSVRLPNGMLNRIHSDEESHFHLLWSTLAKIQAFSIWFSETRHLKMVFLWRLKILEYKAN